MSRSILPLSLLAIVLLPTAAWSQGNTLPPPEAVPAPATGPALSAPAAPYGPAPPQVASPPAAPYYPPPAQYYPQPAYPTYPQLAQQPEYLVQPAVPVGPPGPMADVQVPCDTSSHWMISLEALWLERADDRDVVLGTVVTNPEAFPVDLMTSGDKLFPLAAGTKISLGYRIDDHIALEETYFGFQSWSVGRTMEADPAGDTLLAFSPWTQTDALIDGFNDTLSYKYRSHLNNAEINARMFGAGGYTWSWSWLWGVRYFEMGDKFQLSGTDTDTGDYENIDIKTANNLLGPQIGFQWLRNWDRFQLATEFKAALMANFVSQHYSNLNSSGAASGNPAGFVPIDASSHSTATAGMLEITLIARYRLTDHLWIRGGYENYYIPGLALGPRQLGGFNHSASVFLDGPSLGFEMAW